MIDYHCHLDLYPDPANIIGHCKLRGLHVLSVTTTPTAWQGTRTLARDVPRIRTTLGLHPQLAHERRSELPLFDELLPQVAYVGEIGLDGAPEHSHHWPDQVAVFEHILGKCAAAGGRCMSIHSRRASNAVLDRVEQFPSAGVYILHWFSGSMRELDRAVELGCWFSVGPAMLRAKKGQALAARMPRDRVLTESDGPFARLDGSPILPWQSGMSLHQLSELWSLSLETVNQMVWDNLAMLDSKLNPSTSSPEVDAPP